ncbi:MAG TPA: hypothetical protein VGL24_06010 [Chthoniobacterales bacterium]
MERRERLLAADRSIHRLQLEGNGEMKKGVAPGPGFRIQIGLMAKPNQNKIDKQFTAAQWTSVDDALTAVETLLQDIPTATPKDKARLAKPPEGAGDWMDKMVTMAGLNLDKLRADFTITSVQKDLDWVDAAHIREERVKAIKVKFNDSIFLGLSDAFTACLNIRRALIEGDVPDVDHDLDEGMRNYFRRTKTTPPPTT